MCRQYAMWVFLKTEQSIEKSVIFNQNRQAGETSGGRFHRTYVVFEALKSNEGFKPTQ